MELREVMTTAWTNRFYTAEPVAADILWRILDAARFAPSGGNRQGWRVIVVRDPAARQTIHDLYGLAWAPYRARIEVAATANTTTRLASRSIEAADHFAAHLYEVPVHLVVCVDVATLQIPDAELGRPSITGGASIYPFVHNILLASRDEGLGAALTTLLTSEEAKVKRAFAIPEEFAIAALVALGHPVQERIPKKLARRTVEEFAFLERFGAPFTAAESIES